VCASDRRLFAKPINAIDLLIITVIVSNLLAGFFEFLNAINALHSEWCNKVILQLVEFSSHANIFATCVTN